MFRNHKEYFSKMNISIKVSFIYFVVGIAWILFSDHALTLLVRNQDMINRIQTIKGFLYVFFTAFYRFLFSIRKFNKQQDQLINDLETASPSINTSKSFTISCFSKK